MGDDTTYRTNGADARISNESLRSTVREGLEILQRGRWVILILMVAAFSGAALHVVYWMPPPTYTAEALLLVETSEQQDEKTSLNAGYIDGAVGGSSNLANQLLILEQSQFIARRTAERLLEIHASENTPLPVLQTEEGPRSADELARLLQSDLITVSRADEESDAAWIQATSAHPQEAALLANIYAEEYVARTQEMSRHRISGSRAFLEKQLQARHAELKALEDSIQQMTENGGVALDTEAQRTIEQIAELEAMLDETRIEERTRRASLASVEQELKDLEPKLAERIASGTDQEIQLLQEKLSRLEVLAQQARMRSGPNTAASEREREQLDTQIQTLRRHLDSLSARYVRELLDTRGIDPREASGRGRDYIADLHRQSVEERVALSGIAAKAEALEERLRTYRRKLDALPKQSMQLAQARRAQQASEELYNRLVQRLQEVKIAEESEIGTARVLRSALVPEGPDGIGRQMILALSLLLGLLLGGIGAVVRHKLDVRIHTPEDLSERNASLLSVIPDFARQKLPAVVNEAESHPDHLPEGAFLPVLLSPFLPEAEAFRRLYVNVQFASPDRALKTVLVTSAEKGVGKTTTATNLAIAAAQSGQRTLIIDADLRRPTLHSLIGSNEGPSLETLLIDSTELEDVTSTAFETGIENLWAITSTSPASSPTRLLRSDAMRNLLAALRLHFDFIVMDTPPVLVASETIALATQSDSSLIVTSAGSTAGDALEKTTSELQAAGVSLAGVVLNRFDPTYVYGYASTYKYSYHGYDYGAPA